MATLDTLIEGAHSSLMVLRQASEMGDATEMYEACRVCLGHLSKMLARLAVLQDLRAEAGYAAEVDRALNRNK